MLGYFFKKFFAREKQITAEDLKKTQGILIRPDGSWVVVDNDNPTAPKPHPYSPPPKNTITAIPNIPGKDFNWYKKDPQDIQNSVLAFPPSYFPFANELHNKLEQCIDLDIINSCVHKETQNSVYLLTIELPCLSEHSENMKRFKTFIRAMEDKYNFKTIQQERINNSTCSESQYLVVFEYDPKLHILKKLKEDV